MLNPSPRSGTLAGSHYFECWLCGTLGREPQLRSVDALRNPAFNDEYQIQETTMGNHPNRSKSNPGAPRYPKPDEIREAREAAELTPDEAGEVVHSSAIFWQEWENGERPMHPAFWELFRIKTGQDEEPDPISMEKTGKDEVRLIFNGETVVVARRIEGKYWEAFDKEGQKRISGFSFPSPRDIRNWWRSSNL